MPPRIISVTILLVAGLASPLVEAAPPTRRAPANQAQPADGLREVTTDHYIVRTDLPDDSLPPILQRLEAMVQEYRDRTATLSDQSDDRRLPFHLYSDLRAYTAAGGTAGSAGIYDGERLLAYVGRRPDARAWHTIQHEAFHQYLSAKLGYEIPIWLNEGLAEYFGESLYTGDGFVSGLVPPWRLKRIRESIDRDGFMPLRELLTTSHEQWNQSLDQANYDMAWSLVHFLAHSEGGRHQEELTAYIRESARGTDPLKTFTRTVGDPAEVEASWIAYWRDLSEGEVQRTYGEAAVSTVCSFLGRAATMRSRPANIEELSSLAEAGELPQSVRQALPVSVLIECLSWSRDLGDWSFDHALRTKANVKLKLKDGTLVQGAYIMRAGRFNRVNTWTTLPQASPTTAPRAEPKTAR